MFTKMIMTMMMGQMRVKRKKLSTDSLNCLIKHIKCQNYNPGQNIWNKIEKFSKTGQDKKSLISPFACFLTATAKV